MDLTAELVPVPDEWEPSEEDMKDHWAGEGHLVFHAISHDPEAYWEKWEIDYEEYSGCVGGLDETIGISYAINKGMFIDPDEIRFGFTYTINEITVVFTRGDGWTTDDDTDYYCGEITKQFSLKLWLSCWWWHLIGHRIRNWRVK